MAGESSQDPPSPLDDPDDRNGETTHLLSGCRETETGDDGTRRRTTPLPKLQLFLLCCLRITEPMMLKFLFPFINEMILSFGKTDPTKVGYLSGLLESLFDLTQAITLFGWGYLADRIGRRPVAIIGVAGGSLLTAAFGLSQTFAVAVILRCASGALNGNSATVRTMLAEITDSSNAPLAFPILNVAWQIGASIGPLFGGFTVRPAERFPGLFGDSQFLKDYPYFLPCATTASVPSFLLIFSFFFLKETLPPKSTPQQRTPQSPDAGRGTETDNTSRLTVTRSIVSVLVNSSLANFQQAAFEAIFVLFCFTPRNYGGLAFTPAQISTCIAANAVTVMLIEVPSSPVFVRWLGLKGSAESYGAGLPALIWVGLGIVLILHVFAQQVFLCCDMLVTRAPKTRETLGQVVAVAAVVGCTSWLAGLAVGSSVFAASVDNQLLKGYAVWPIMFLVSLMTAFSSACLKVEDGWREKEEALGRFAEAA